MKKLDKKGKILLAVGIVVFVVILLILTFMLLLNQKPIEEVDEETESTVSLAEQVKTPVEISEKCVNILVLGIADDEEYRKSTRMTDVIMIVSMNLEEDSVSILQIPRDTYVSDYTDNYKINDVYNSPDSYTYHGVDGLADLIYDMYKINIDHYVTMQMDGFSDIVDAIGGVTMNVPTTVSAGSKNGKITVEEGMQTLDGQHALVVVRNRHVYYNADLGRLDTQKLFLSAFAKKLKSLNMAQVAALLPTIMGCCTTDLSVGEVLSYYQKMSSIDLNDIIAVTIPATTGVIHSQSVVSPYPSRTAYILNTYFRPFTSDVPVEDLNIYTISDADPAVNEEEMDATVKHFGDEEEEDTESESESSSSEE